MNPASPDNAATPASPDQPLISVVLPTFNELANIVPLVSEIFQRTAAAGQRVQVVVVDDDSQDGTQEALQESFGQDQRLRLVVRKNERGLATALWRGINEAQGQVVVTMDSDFNHHPRDLLRVMAALPGQDLVIGSRYVPGGGMNTSWLRFQLSHAFNIMLRLLLGLKTRDNLSGFLAMSKSLWLSFDPADIFQGYGDYAIRLLYRAQQRGLKITEVPVVYEDRLGGDSKTRFVHHLGEYLRTAYSLRRENRR
ncbi:MAG: glycosyltransferase [Pseudomonadota bacterium]